MARGGSEQVVYRALDHALGAILGVPQAEDAAELDEAATAASGEALALQARAARLRQRAAAVREHVAALGAVASADAACAAASLALTAALEEVLRCSAHAAKARRVLLRTMPGADLSRGEGIVWLAARLDVTWQCRLGAACKRHDAAFGAALAAREAREAAHKRLDRAAGALADVPMPCCGSG